MRNEPGDFGPELVTPATVQSWLDRLSRKRAPAAERAAPVSPIGRSPPRPAHAPLVSTEAQPRARRVLPMASIFATVVLAVAVWAASGFYRVQPDQVGLVLRFGELVETTGPGLNYHWPYLIEFVLLPRVTAINQVKIGNGTVMQMLTGDENIVEATASISWRVKDPSKFLFNVYDPEGAVKLAGESAVRQIIGLNPIQSGLSDQRQKIADDAQSLLQRILNSTTPEFRSRKCSCSASIRPSRSLMRSMTCNVRAPINSGRATRPKPIATTFCRAPAPRPIA